MNRSHQLVLAALAGGAVVALAQGAYTVTVAGKPVTIEHLERNGKLLVDAEALAKALGASVTLDRAKRTLVVVPAAAGAASVAQVQGTTQLAGAEGEVGKTYTLGKASPLNFTLRGAEFTVARVNVGTNSIVPEAGEKLLVVRFSVQNPQNREVRYAWSDLRFTAVDAKDVSREFAQAVGREGTSDSLSLSLKPAQKIDAFTVIKVPAEGVVPKLIVMREKDAPVLRYDLRAVAKGPGAPFADPADASGATILESVPAETGKFYPLGQLDARLDSVAFTTEPLNKRAPAAGQRYLVATFTLKNMSARNTNYNWATIRPELVDADGEKVAYNQQMLKAARDETASGQLKPGEEAKVRYFFALPEDVGGKSILMAEGKSRAYAFDVSAAK